MRVLPSVAGIKKGFVIFFLFFLLLPVFGETNSRQYSQQKQLAEFADSLKKADAARKNRQLDLEKQFLNEAKDSLQKLPENSANAIIKKDFEQILTEHDFNRLHGSKNKRLFHLYQGLFEICKGGLYEHLADAIRSHEERMPFYARLTRGESDSIFKTIASKQKMNLPVSWYIDVQARKFQKDGIPIIVGDLKNMNTIRPKEQAPDFTNTMPEEVFTDISLHIRDLQKKAMRALSKNNFNEVAAETYNTARYIRMLENKYRAHMAMTVHMLDSLGYTSLHAAQYQKQSAGETDSLARQFIAIHIIPLQDCLPTDQKAQKLHKLGVGVIVNDVPDIPFFQEWQRLHR